jgi:hypothetical protein
MGMHEILIYNRFYTTLVISFESPQTIATRF